MNLFTTRKLETMEDVLAWQLEDLYDAERRFIEALPRMAESTTSPELQMEVRSHENETRGHMERLEQVLQSIGRQPGRQSCEAMKGILREADEVIDADGDPVVKDAALIGAVQRVKHYEIAGYGTTRKFAEDLGRPEIAEMLGQTLEEEKIADRRLTDVALRSVNNQAVHATA